MQPPSHDSRRQVSQGGGALAHSLLCPCVAVLAGTSAQTLALAARLSQAGDESGEHNALSLLSGRNPAQLLFTFWAGTVTKCQILTERVASPCQGHWLLLGWAGAETGQLMLPDGWCGSGSKSYSGSFTSMTSACPAEPVSSFLERDVGRTDVAVSLGGFRNKAGRPRAQHSARPRRARGAGGWLPGPRRCCSAGWVMPESDSQAPARSRQFACAEPQLRCPWNRNRQEGPPALCCRDSVTNVHTAGP